MSHLYLDWPQVSILRGDAAATHPLSVTVHLHSSSIGAPYPVVSRGAACGELTAGSCRVGLGLTNKTKGWYNGVTYQVSSVLDSLISCCFLHLIRRADSLLVIDHSCREGEGEDDVSLAGGGSGKRDQS